MKKYEKAVLCLRKHPDVAFTDNRAERDLRMCNYQAELVSGCFRTRKYAEAYCHVESQATSSPWRTRDTILWWPFKSLSPDAPSITCPSSYR